MISHLLEKPSMKTHTARYSIQLIAAATLFWSSLYTYPAIISPYLTTLGASSTSIGLVIGSYGLTQTVLRIPAGILSDRLRNKKIFIVVGLLLSLISAAGLFLFRDVGLILLFRALSGVAAAIWVHFTTLYLTYFQAEAAAPAIGRLSFSVSLSQMAAMLAGSFLAQFLGWPYAFLLGLLMAIPGFFVSLWIYEKKPSTDQVLEKPLSMRQVFEIGRDRRLFWTAILALLSQLVIYASTLGFVPQYASQLGADKSVIGWLAAFTMLPRALAALLGGNLLARWFKLRTMVMIGFVLLGLTTCLLPLVNSLPLLFINQFFSGIGSGLLFTILLAMCTQTVPLDRKASAMGFFQAVYGIGMVVGPALVGVLADLFNLETGFVIVGAVSLLTAILTILVI
jgi:MFS family permease